MDISAKNAKIWRKDIEGKNGTFHVYSTGVSSKNQDGTYTNAYIDVFFSKKSGAPEKISNGAVCDFDGFMSAHTYKNKDGKTVAVPQIVVMSVQFKDEVVDKEADVDDSFEQLDDDMPF